MTFLNPDATNAGMDQKPRPTSDVDLAKEAIRDVCWSRYSREADRLEAARLLLALSGFSIYGPYPSYEPGTPDK